MSALLVGLLGFGLALAAGLAWSRRVKAAAASAGMARLNDLRWRDFERTVVTALEARGYRLAEAQDGTIDRDDLLLEHEGERVLLVCKQGAGTTAPSVLHALARQLPLRSADRGLLVSTGHFDDEVVSAARAQRIELIDGEALWPLVAPILQPEGAEPATPATDRKPQVVAWLGALGVGAIAWMLAQGLQRAVDPEAEAAIPTPVPRAAPSATGQPAQPVQQPHETIPTDPAALQQRRSDTVDVVVTLPGVATALWSTQSTLLVHLAAEGADPMAQLCPLLVRYPELAASRVQLQPPQGSTAPVRFRQCRSY